MSVCDTLPIIRYFYFVLYNIFLILFGEDVSHLIYTEEFINYNRVTVLGQKVKHCMRRLLISCASINLSDYVGDHVPHENIWAYFATQDFEERETQYLCSVLYR